MVMQEYYQSLSLKALYKANSESLSQQLLRRYNAAVPATSLSL